MKTICNNVAVVYEDNLEQVVVDVETLLYQGWVLAGPIQMTFSEGKHTYIATLVREQVDLP